MIVVCVFVGQDYVWGSAPGAWSMKSRERRPYVVESASAKEDIMEDFALTVG